jgi:hypothetical protein
LSGVGLGQGGFNCQRHAPRSEFVNDVSCGQFGSDVTLSSKCTSVPPKTRFRTSASRTGCVGAIDDGTAAHDVGTLLALVCHCQLHHNPCLLTTYGGDLRSSCFPSRILLGPPPGSIHLFPNLRSQLFRSVIGNFCAEPNSRKLAPTFGRVFSGQAPLFLSLLSARHSV